MAPKKKPQSSKSKGKASSSSSAGPKLQISAENENRLRRLLLNSGRLTQSPAPNPTTTEDAVSKAQKARKLSSIYEKLSCEGFLDDQIERALSSLKVLINKPPYEFCVHSIECFSFNRSISSKNFFSLCMHHIIDTYIYKVEAWQFQERSCILFCFCKRSISSRKKFNLLFNCVIS